MHRNSLFLRAGLGLALAAGVPAAMLLSQSSAAQDTTRPATAAAPTDGTAATTPAEQAAIASAERVGGAFAAVAEQVSPSVVSIRVEARVDAAEVMGPFRFFPGMPGAPGDGEDPIVRGGGSGFVISPDGAIVTNRHVVENATRIRVVFRDGRDLPATVVGLDRATDLAVLRVAASGLTPLRFADMDAQRVGQWVVAIGSPFGLDTTVTAGVLSAIGRGGIGVNEIEDYVQTDASINPGNSGGPLVNLDGEVIGVNSMIVGRGQGIGFAIPADIARNVAEQLLAHGRVRRAWIGVGFQELTPELAADFGIRDRRGALVNEIVPTGPAARGGLENGDVIVGIDGRTVNEARDLMRQVIRRPIGADLRLDVVRNGQVRAVTITTAERPDAEPEPAAAPQEAPRATRTERGFGLSLVAMTPQIAEQLGRQPTSGAVVAQVQRGGAADRAGLQRGDVIVEADRRAVTAPTDVERAASDGHAMLRVERGARRFYTVLDRE
jgi:Do/DeqQ family serine protease